MNQNRKSDYCRKVKNMKLKNHLYSIVIHNKHFDSVIDDSDTVLINDNMNF